MPLLYRLRTSVVAALLLSALWGIALNPASAGVSPRNLAPHYRHWLSEEVNYIISTDERKAFVGLKSDEERDQFIKNFWDLRNPDPHSDSNSYRDEHYRRLAYANQTFGHPMLGDGWRTDMGQIYITLGAPKQKADYQTGQNVRQMQIWFYQSETPALPPYFYILFYKRSPIDDYTLYSPYQDGPVRLVTTLENMNDQKKSLDIIRKSMGDEVARTTLSLIPNEPVDFSSYSPSLTSDVLLSNIRGLADNPINLQKINERRMNEQVTTRLLFGSGPTELQTAVFRGEGRRSTVHYLLRFREPESTLIGPIGKDTGYKLMLETTVITAAGKPVFRDQSTLTGAVSDAQADVLRHQPFAAAGRLPLAPGKYKVLATLTNQLNHAAYRQQEEVVVPEPSGIGLELSSVVAFSSVPPVADADGHLPFDVSGIHFEPIGIGSATIHQGEPLRVFTEVWSDLAHDAAHAGRKLNFRYAYGSLSGANTETEVDSVDEGTFDANGSLLTGKKLATDHLSSGNYRLAVTTVEEGGERHAYATLNFQVVPSNMPAGLWTAHDPGLVQLAGYGQDDYKRGLSATAQGESTDAAAAWFSLAVNATPPYEQGLPRLVSVLSQQQKYAELAQLGQRFAESRALDTKTAVLLARGIAKSGDIKLATKVLESAMSWQAPTVEMFSTLAAFYRQSGDNSRAAEFEARSKTL